MNKTSKDMKHRFLMLVPVLVLAYACQAERDVPDAPAVPVGEGPVFYATIESGSDDTSTRVYADENMAVLWNADDRISIFEKFTYNREYAFQGEDGDNSGSFTRVDNGAAGSGSTLPNYYAVYPFAAGTGISAEGVLSVALPAEQAYRAGSFGNGANLMVSVSEDTHLLFKNVGSCLILKLYGDGVSVSRITLQGNNQEILSGNATVTMAAGGNPAITMAETAQGGSGTVSLVCTTPVALGADAESSTEFWIIVPPTYFEEGFTVTVEDSDGHTFQKAQ